MSRCLRWCLEEQQSVVILASPSEEVTGIHRSPAWCFDPVDPPCDHGLYHGAVQKSLIYRMVQGGAPVRNRVQLGFT